MGWGRRLAMLYRRSLSQTSYSIHRSANNEMMSYDMSSDYALFPQIDSDVTPIGTIDVYGTISTEQK